MFLTHPAPGNLRILDTAPLPTPSQEALERVDELWRQSLERVPGLFDGRVFSLEHFEGGDAVGFLAPYKWYLAQLAEPELYSELRVRSLALSGLVVASGHLFFGLRRRNLAVEPNLWETAPSGTLDASIREPDGSISWRGAFAAEMRVELGIDPAACDPRPFALVEDTGTRIIETGLLLELPMDHRDVLAAYVGSPAPEHCEMAAVPLHDVARFLKERAAAMTGACPHLVAASGLIPAS